VFIQNMAIRSLWLIKANSVDVLNTNDSPKKNREYFTRFILRAIMTNSSCKTCFCAPVTDVAFRQAWDRLRTRANINDLTFHDLRHEAISRMFDNGMKIHEVMAVSGHRTASQLLRYAQVIR